MSPRINSKGRGGGGPPPPLKSIPVQLKSIPWGGGGHYWFYHFFLGGGVKGPFLWYINSVPWPNQFWTHPYLCKQELQLCSSRARFRDNWKCRNSSGACQMAFRLQDFLSSPNAHWKENTAWHLLLPDVANAFPRTLTSRMFQKCPGVGLALFSSQTVDTAALWGGHALKQRSTAHHESQDWCFIPHFHKYQSVCSPQSTYIYVVYSLTVMKGFSCARRPLFLLDCSSGLRPRKLAGMLGCIDPHFLPQTCLYTQFIATFAKQYWKCLW